MVSIHDFDSWSRGSSPLTTTKYATMGELVDPLDSKSSSRNGVWVRVPLVVLKVNAPVAEWSNATVCKTVQSLVQI